MNDAQRETVKKLKESFEELTRLRADLRETRNKMLKLARQEVVVLADWRNSTARRIEAQERLNKIFTSLEELT